MNTQIFKEPLFEKVMKLNKDNDMYWKRKIQKGLRSYQYSIPDCSHTIIISNYVISIDDSPLYSKVIIKQNDIVVETSIIKLDDRIIDLYDIIIRYPEIARYIATIHQSCNHSCEHICD